MQTKKMLGLMFIAVLAALATPGRLVAQARSTTAFNSFHVQSAYVGKEDPYLCLTEDNGAVVNNCSYSVNLLFDLPIDHIGDNTIRVQDYWGAPREFVQFGCTSYVYTGSEGGSFVGTSLTFTAPKMALNTKDNVPALGDSMTVICWAVPPGEGVANLNWNP